MEMYTVYTGCLKSKMAIWREDTMGTVTRQKDRKQEKKIYKINV